ncbi:hypothetical protein GCM10009550_53970 [Actinocorallia libanotica]|uniref:Uncharacterized protein n=1 Tax=Actinocorallia libanotica TaxID=46162 RepID=A0ABN1RPZ4_9ACTN
MRADDSALAGAQRLMVLDLLRGDLFGLQERGDRLVGLSPLRRSAGDIDGQPSLALVRQRRGIDRPGNAERVSDGPQLDGGPVMFPGPHGDGRGQVGGIRSLSLMVYVSGG